MGHISGDLTIAPPKSANYVYNLWGVVQYVFIELKNNTIEFKPYIHSSELMRILIMMPRPFPKCFWQNLITLQ